MANKPDGALAGSTGAPVAQDSPAWRITHRKDPPRCPAPRVFYRFPGGGRVAEVDYAMTIFIDRTGVVFASGADPMGAADGRFG